MTITSTRLIISFLLFILTISGQLNAQEEQEFPTDPVMSEKLKNIQTLEQLLEITENDRQASGVINDQREQKFLAARDRQKFPFGTGSSTLGSRGKTKRPIAETI